MDGYPATLAVWQQLNQGTLQHVHHIKTFWVDGTLHAISLVPFFWTDLHWIDPDYNKGNVWKFWRWDMTFEKFAPYPHTPSHAECVADYEPLKLNGATYLVEVSFIPRAPSPCGQNAKLLRWNGKNWGPQADIPPIPVNNSWKVKAMDLGGTAHLVFSPGARRSDKMTLWRFNGRAFQQVQEIPEIGGRQYLTWSLTKIDNEAYFIVGVWPLVLRRRLSLLEGELSDTTFGELIGESNHSGASSLPRWLYEAAPQSDFNVVVFRYTGAAFQVHQTWGNNPGCGKLQKITCKPGCSGLIPAIIGGKHYLLEQHVVGGLWLHRWTGKSWQVYQYISARNNAAAALFTASDDLLNPEDPNFGKGDSLTLSSRYGGSRNGENLLWRWNGTYFHPSAKFSAPPEKTAIPYPTWSVFKIGKRTFLVSTSGIVFTPATATTSTITTSTTMVANPTTTTITSLTNLESRVKAPLVISSARKKQSRPFFSTMAIALALAL